MKKYTVFLPNGDSIAINAEEHSISTKDNFIFFYDQFHHTVAIFAVANIVGITVDSDL